MEKKNHPDEKPRRSAGMRGTPVAGPFAPPPQAAFAPCGAQDGAAARPAAKASKYVRPQVLMGETGAPRPAITASRCEALRAFMAKNRLRPTSWAQQAGVPLGELMAFLTGKSRSLSPQTISRLAQAAKAAPDELFR